MENNCNKCSERKECGQLYLAVYQSMNKFNFSITEALDIIDIQKQLAEYKTTWKVI